MPEHTYLPYWVRDHIHSQTRRLICAWLEWESKDGFRPGTLCLRPGAFEDSWKVAEMGWAFMELEEWKQIVIKAHFTMGREAWIDFTRTWKISKRKFDSMLLDLQDLARARGLLEEEDLELARAAREQGPPQERSFSSAGRRSSSA